MRYLEATVQPSEKAAKIRISGDSVRKTLSDTSRNYNDTSTAGQKSLLERYGLKNGDGRSIR